MFPGPLSRAGWLIACALLASACSPDEQDARVAESTKPTALVADAIEPEPEPAVEAPIPEAPGAVASAEAPKGADALRAKLLGLDKKPVPEPEAEPEPEARPVRRSRPVSRPLEAEPEEAFSYGLSDHMFKQTIDSWAGMKGCLAEVTARDEASGALRVAFKIASDGAVLQSKVFGMSNEAAKALAPCVERRARRLKFPTFTAEEPATKVAKFVF